MVVVGFCAAHTTRAVDYSRDIKPILSENCFSCHGFDEKARKGKLRLDVAESAYAERNGMARIKPGDLTNSEVWARIISTDAEEVMPPPKDHAPLSAVQKEKIKAWIEEGAKYSEHWSFVAPRKAPLAAGTVAGANLIDAFVRMQLAKEKLAPAAEADRRTLARRVALDLTGLPPSSAEVEAFANDRNNVVRGHTCRLVDEQHSVDFLCTHESV
jgi:hypothetical protein